MKFFNILSLAVLMLMFVSCQNTGRIVFFGETARVSYPRTITILEGRTVYLEGIYTGAIFAYDNILVFQSHRHPDGILYVFDAETGNRISAIAQRGAGPDEFIHIGFSNFERNINDEINVWITHPQGHELVLLSLHGNIVKRIHTSKFESTNFFGIGDFFVLSDSLLIAYMQAREIFENKFTPPFYRVFNYHTGEIVKDFVHYSEYEMDKGNLVSARFSTPLHWTSTIKPNRSKIAMAMMGLNRVNILDLKSGKMKSIETRSARSLNQLRLCDHIKSYFGGISSDERYIFVRVGDLIEPSKRIHVFDWKGNFMYILQLSEGAMSFSFDPVHKILYSITYKDRVIAYDLNFLYQ